jgi:signal transduction histidine kinase
VEAELQVHLDQIVAGLDRSADGTFMLSRPVADPRFAAPLSGLYWQIDVDATRLRSRSLWDSELPLPADELADGTIHRHRIAGPGESELIALERGVTLPARLGGRTMRAAVAIDAAEVRSATRDFADELVPYLTVLALFLIGAAYVQVSVGLRPLAAVRRRLSAIAMGRESRLGGDFPDEILPLAGEVDALLDARDVQLERARARAADLAHGLKTPLQVLSGDVGRLERKGETEIAAEIRDVATAMRRHVDRELARARMAAGRPDARADIDGVIRQVVAVVSRTPEGSLREWSVAVPRGLVARIDPDDLAEAMGNLAENAARHARRKVSVTARREDGKIEIAVIDDGPGIASRDMDHVLSRGGRFDSRGGGAGLGLAIVQDIADAWDGRVDLRSSPDGLEAVFIVSGT